MAYDISTIFPLVNFILIIVYLVYFLVQTRGVSLKRFEAMEYRLDSCFKDKAELRGEIIELERKIIQLNKEISKYRFELNREFWETEKAGLEQSHRLISDFIKELRNQLITETRIEEQVRIREVLEMKEAERENIEHDIDCLDRKLEK